MGQVYIFDRKRRAKRRGRSAAIRITALAAVAIVLTLPPEARDALFGAVGSLAEAAPFARDDALRCTSLTVIDGDTLDCAGVRVRLAGIDAPEMPGHCREGRDCTPGDPYAARAALMDFARPGLVCRGTETDRYGRTVARCEADGRDASCTLLAEGHAVRRYGAIGCSGRV